MILEWRCPRKNGKSFTHAIRTESLEVGPSLGLLSQTDCIASAAAPLHELRRQIQKAKLTTCSNARFDVRFRVPRITLEALDSELRQRGLPADFQIYCCVIWSQYGYGIVHASFAP